MPTEPNRGVSTQSRGRRHIEIRNTNYEESAAELHRVVVHNDYEAADTEAEGSADYGPAIRVDNFEHLDCYLEHVAGTATTIVHVAMQALSFNQDPSAPASLWMDVHEDEANDGALVRKVYDWTTSVSGLIVFKVPRVGRFMRFKVWTTATNRANSRILLTAARVMEGH